mmetsp:Transcript_22485/g.55643  ORF Transcript_22485/g.55643 Transcript_22485/m.55643 type:complete len:226 (-) Transcript_22485:93-770(-)
MSLALDSSATWWRCVKAQTWQPSSTSTRYQSWREPRSASSWASRPLCSPQTCACQGRWRIRKRFQAIRAILSFTTRRLLGAFSRLFQGRGLTHWWRRCAPAGIQRRVSLGKPSLTCPRRRAILHNWFMCKTKSTSFLRRVRVMSLLRPSTRTAARLETVRCLLKRKRCLPQAERKLAQILPDLMAEDDGASFLSRILLIIIGSSFLLVSSHSWESRLSLHRWGVY